MRKCSKCKHDRKYSDFLPNQIDCYKCEYENKLRLYKTKIRNIKCRMCDNYCKGTRWKYCSDECAKIGEYNLKKDYWTKKIFV